MRTRAGLVMLSLGLTSLVAPRSARACGGFFGDVNQSVVTMSDIRVLLVRRHNSAVDAGNDPDRLDQYVQIAYQGEAARFAWVYPVAANPEVSEAGSSPFPDLEQATAPQISIHSASSGGGGDSGCACIGDDDGKSLRAGDQVVSPTVKVWQTGQVGAFDYVVLSAPTSQTLLDWLHDNGFAVPASAAPVLDHYVSLGWLFVAMKVSVQKVASQVPSTTVVRLSHDLPADAPVRYPLRMVSLSPAAELTLEIFVAGTSAVTPQAPFTAVKFPGDKLKALSPTTHNYDAVFVETAHSAPRVLVLEYASSVAMSNLDRLAGVLGGPSSVLTRFRGVLAPSVMDQDLLFDAGGTADFVPSYHLTYGSPDARSAGVPPPAAALALVWLACRAWRRRRRASSQRPA